MTWEGGTIGAHDLGGAQGFGAVPVSEPGQDVLECRAAALVTIIAVLRRVCTIEQLRAGIEGMAPSAYLHTSYAGRWVHGLEGALARSHILTETEIDARAAEIAATNGATTGSTDPDPDRIREVEALIEHGGPFVGELSRPRAFDVGDPVRARVRPIERSGEDHTRLPGYVQGKEGTVQICLPPFVLPDANMEGGNEVEHVYSVRFAASDVWPDSDGFGFVCVDLWESYLEHA